MNVENGVQCIASRDDYGKFLRFKSKQEAEIAGHMYATDVTEQLEFALLLIFVQVVA